jgi:prevent-host-death family protein
MSDERRPRKQKPTPKSVRSHEARAKWADLLGRVEFAGERFAITKHGKEVAWLVPPQADAA